MSLFCQKALKIQKNTKMKVTNNKKKKNKILDPQYSKINNLLKKLIMQINI